MLLAVRCGLIVRSSDENLFIASCVNFSWSEALALGSLRVTVMRRLATRWAAVRVLVAPCVNEAVVVGGGEGGGGGGGGGGGCVPPTHRASAPPRWAPHARGPALCMSLMWERACRRKGAAVADRGQAWLS